MSDTIIPFATDSMNGFDKLNPLYYDDDYISYVAELERFKQDLLDGQFNDENVYITVGCGNNPNHQFPYFIENGTLIMIDGKLNFDINYFRNKYDVEIISDNKFIINNTKVFTYKTYMPSRNNFKYKSNEIIQEEEQQKGFQIMKQNLKSFEYVEEFYNILTDAILDMTTCNLYNFAIIPSSKNNFGIFFEFYPEILQTYDYCNNLKLHTWLGNYCNYLFELNRDKKTKYGINTQICKIFVNKSNKNYDDYPNMTSV